MANFLLKLLEGIGSLNDTSEGRMNLRQIAGQDLDYNTQLYKTDLVAEENQLKRAQAQQSAQALQGLAQQDFSQGFNPEVMRALIAAGRVEDAMGYYKAANKQATMQPVTLPDGSVMGYDKYSNTMTPAGMAGQGGSMGGGNWQQGEYEHPVSEMTNNIPPQLRGNPAAYQKYLEKQAEIEVNGTAGEKALDQAFGKEYANYTAGGGYSGVEKQLGQLEGVLSKIAPQDGQAPQNLSDPMYSFVPDSIMPFINPDALSAREDVQSAVQASLRQALGSAYTEREGADLMKRAYNPALDEATNAKRLASLINQIKQAAETKRDASSYFEQNGTLRGWKGKMPSMADFKIDDASQPKVQQSQSTDTPKIRVFNQQTGRLE